MGAWDRPCRDADEIIRVVGSNALVGRLRDEHRKISATNFYPAAIIVSTA